MNQLIQAGGMAATMSSIDLLQLVNEARREFGESEVRRNDFTARCKDELEGEYYEIFVVSKPTARRPKRCACHATSACTSSCGSPKLCAVQ
ncbi:Uncharacterised protein [Achromobacter xylosoxidans]|uniref:hypothetical protein n=1 Tax=Alcaligenes xylosoxydans xylosoxydans TaxID=85698 RepID=UPI0006C4194C|nr:hypothetical protein [Achromobacter xylosoxidans]QEQ24926.1 hypothetical protein F0U64_22450 [Achromobacter xylosoxidans]CUI69640.1 Uncharacterised protein [Achromobacter xylosoxidans]